MSFMVEALDAWAKDTRKPRWYDTPLFIVQITAWCALWLLVVAAIVAAIGTLVWMLFTNLMLLF